ncbi:MAG: restriction endonuclease subunit R [Leptolyngbyaceae cyanobacterium SL_5_14]|nr:restriction endonuclease subunit R [Leptolyngbyaceae cyanobacterium SL_5_14]
MPQIVSASDSLHEVKSRFNLQQVWDESFFLEWQQEPPDLTDEEERWLDKIKADFLSLADYSLHEEVVKLTVLAPLLFLAGLTHFPFIPVAEQLVEIAFEAEDQIIRGRIDLLILHQQLWAIVVESKAKKIDVMEALPQALTYMTSKLKPNRPMFGLLTNGSNFIFLKLSQQGSPHYALSELLTLFRRENDLYRVLSVLKHLRDLVQRE